MRLVLIVSLVLGVTAAAPALGPEVSGVLASFPLRGIILTVFAHRVAGPGAAQGVMRGMLAGLFSFAVFFYVLSLLLTRLALPAAYGASVVVSLVTQAL